MSVVGDDWEKLKRYNLYELQSPSTSPKPGALQDVKPKATPESVITDETRTPSKQPKLLSTSLDD